MAAAGGEGAPTGGGGSLRARGSTGRARAAGVGLGGAPGGERPPLLGGPRAVSGVGGHG